jgi:hypothetical protein
MRTEFRDYLFNKEYLTNKLNYGLHLNLGGKNDS